MVWGESAGVNQVMSLDHAVSPAAERHRTVNQLNVTRALGVERLKCEVSCGVVRRQLISHFYNWFANRFKLGLCEKSMREKQKNEAVDTDVKTLYSCFICDPDADHSEMFTEVSFHTLLNAQAAETVRYFTSKKK